jgi:hypothetical protein
MRIDEYSATLTSLADARVGFLSRTIDGRACAQHCAIQVIYVDVINGKPLCGLQSS